MNLKMFLRRSSTLKYFIAAIVGAALYSEFYVYQFSQYFYWHKLECERNDPSCLKILFVADPQIQGDYAGPLLLNFLLQFDSDKYLIYTFHAVIRYFKPDVIVYLGDLMDEGSIATKEQFHYYVERLETIFYCDFPAVAELHCPLQQVWVPGDNDIGGENEPIRKDKIEEFNKAFPQPDVVNFRNVSFYKVNGITHTYPKEVTDDDLRIVVSHYPITARHMFGQMVNNAIRPHIYFCAHDHESKYVTQNKQLTFRETHRLQYGDNILEIPLGPDEESLYEIYVPTCSYRMGTSKIGYGAAILDKNNQRMRYTVFWSPERFRYLIFYLFCVIILNAYFCIFCAARCFYSGKRIVSTRNEEHVPFLERI